MNDDETAFGGGRAFADAITLCNLVTNAKTIRAQLKRLRKLQRDIADAEGKVIAVQDQATQTNAALDQRQAAADERERLIAQREDEFESSLQEARDNLHVYYNSLAETDRHIRHRILSSAGLLSGYNAQLQDLPTWDQLKRLVVGLPDDRPPIEREVAFHPRIDALSDTSDDPHADRQGAPFLGGLSRDVSHHKRKSAA